MVLAGLLLIALGVPMIWVAFGIGDRRHFNCRWWVQWRHRPCYACICDMEREIFGSPDLAHLYRPPGYYPRRVLS